MTSRKPSKSKPDDPVTAYAQAVVDGEIVAGRLVRLACARHLRDLVEGPARGLKWELESALKGIAFFSFLQLPDSDEPFKLQPWQQFIIGCLLGWKSADGYRRFRTAYNEIGKGNGKTPMSAGLAIRAVVADGEQSAEAYAAATTREQASIAFADARKIALSSPALSKRLKIDERNISYPKTFSFFRPISSEGRGLDGKRPHYVSIDELHEHPSSIVADKMRAGTKGRKQALIFIITNSGYNRQTVCWHYREYAVKVLTGVLEDDSFFAYVCQLDCCQKCLDEGKTSPTDNCPDCDKWTDEAVWLKANPNLGVSIQLKYLREQVREALGMPTKESIVRRLNFCEWMAAAVHAIATDKWNACQREVKIEEFAGRECFAAFDVGAISDFCALACLFPHDDAETIELPANAKEPDGPKISIVRRSYTCIPTFWLPEKPCKRDQRMENILNGWRKKGFIRETSGDVVDYDQVHDDIAKILEPLLLNKLAIDFGFQGLQICTRLMKTFGQDRIFIFRQGILSFAAPFREFLELLMAGRFYHDGNPVQTWMASNCQAETKGGLSKPSKDKSTEKIDGITAAVMGLGVAMVTPPQLKPEFDFI